MELEHSSLVPVERGPRPIRRLPIISSPVAPSPPESLSRAIFKMTQTNIFFSKYTSVDATNGVTTAITVKKTASVALS